MSEDQKAKNHFRRWNKLGTLYFQRWVWEEICRKFPNKYKMFLPEYQGQKVIFT